MLTENQDWLRKISQREFATLGINVVAYVKPVQGDKFSIYAADGSNLGSSSSKDSAVQAICLSDLIPVSVH